MDITGIGQDAITVVNERGGKQSKCVGRADLLPAASLISISRILDAGAAKYGVNNWRKIDSQSHLNHAFLHILALLAGDTQDDHMGHAACRMLMAHEMKLAEESKIVVPDETKEVPEIKPKKEPRFLRCVHSHMCSCPINSTEEDGCNPDKCAGYSPEVVPCIYSGTPLCAIRGVVKTGNAGCNPTQCPSYLPTKRRNCL